MTTSDQQIDVNGASAFGLHRSLGRSGELFSDLSPDAIAFLMSVSADIALVVEPDGTIVDVAYEDKTIDAWEPDGWLGRNMSDIVTVECTDKIASLLSEIEHSSSTRRRQVNHAAAGHPDLPVSYRLIALDDKPQKLALGEDFRKIANIQQRLVQTQFELETEYRKIREAEGRYRTIFQKSEQPVIAIDGESGMVIDINMAATSIIGTKRAKLNGENATSCFARADRSEIVNAISEARHSGSPKAVRATIANSGRMIELSLEPFRENGRTNILATIHTLEQNGVGDTALADDNMVLDSFPEALVTTDLKGNIIEVNDQFLDLVHVLNKSALISRNLNTWLGGSTVDMQVLLTRLREERQVRQFSSVIRDELGDSIPVTVSASRYGEDGSARIGIFISDMVRRDTPMTVPAPGSNGASSDFAELVGRVPLKELIREASDVIEKMCIEAALRQTENNRASAADMLGLSRQSLYIKLRRHGLENYTGKQ